MKKIITIFAMAAIALATSGCSDFLRERGETTYDGKAMISSKSALESAVLGIHRQLASSGFKSGAFCEWLAPASGLAIWGNTNALVNPQERWICLHKFTRFSKHPESYDSFRSFYKTVYLCNHLLEIIENSPVDKAYVEQIKGEVYFLRAMTYFYLVRLYGNVSLHLDAPKDVTADVLYKPRENFWTVYCQIIKDLNMAQEKMRTFDEMIKVAQGSHDAGEYFAELGNASGRVCDYAAVACRSLVYLTIGSLLSSPDDNFWLPEYGDPDFLEIEIETPEDAFRLALKDAEDVLDNGPFKLCPDYRELFRWSAHSDWQLKERIWAMPRSPESTDAGSGLTLWALPCYYNGTGNVENFGRCRPDRWFYQKWCERYGGKTGSEMEQGIKYGTHNSDMYVTSADPRFDVNFIHTQYVGKEGVIYNCYPADDRIYIENSSLMKYYGIPFYKKYYDPTFDNSVGNADLYVMRLAEVYLIAAEAAAWLGKKQKAVDYVNVLLARARNSADTPSEQPADWKAADFVDDESLLNAIFWERCFEMPFEHHEYFDTHRRGAQWIVDNICKPKNKFLYEDEQEDFYKEDVRYIGYRTIYYGEKFKYDENPDMVRKGLICAYPYDELVYNPYLEINTYHPNNGQNPERVYWR